MTNKREIKVAHSPDSDDAFMFYGLATDKLDTGELQFTHVLKDIQSLNQIAMTTREYDVTAVSFHAYAHIAEHYALLPHGASIGDGHGPRCRRASAVLASQNQRQDDCDSRHAHVGVPRAPAAHAGVQV